MKVQGYALNPRALVHTSAGEAVTASGNENRRPKLTRESESRKPQPLRRLKRITYRLRGVGMDALYQDQTAFRQLMLQIAKIQEAKQADGTSKKVVVLKQ